MIRLLIASDYRMFRQGLTRLLNDQSDLQLVVEAGNWTEVIDAVRDHDLDVAVLALSMRGRAAAEMIDRIKAMRPAMNLLIVAMQEEESVVLRALRIGIDGYMTKDKAAEEMVRVIAQMGHRGRYICAAIAEQSNADKLRNGEDDDPHALLSNREYRIFEMLISGKRGSQIAHELSLSEKTVSTHKASVLRKLQLKNDTELVRYAIRHQLVAP